MGNHTSTEISEYFVNTRSFDTIQSIISVNGIDGRTLSEISSDAEISEILHELKIESDALCTKIRCLLHKHYKIFHEPVPHNIPLSEDGEISTDSTEREVAIYIINTAPGFKCYSIAEVPTLKLGVDGTVLFHVLMNDQLPSLCDELGIEMKIHRKRLQSRFNRSKIMEILKSFPQELTTHGWYFARGPESITSLGIPGLDLDSVTELFMAPWTKSSSE